MQLFSALTAFAAFNLALALPSGAETGVVTQVTTDEIPAAYKISNETLIATRNLEERASLGVYFCVNANWGSPCQHITSQPNQCIGFDSTLDGRISSIGPDQGTYCRFFYSYNCIDSSPSNCEHLDLQYPGFADLSKFSGCGPNPNDRIHSYFCVPTS
ncbi:hypothetical protein B0T20DRAFT_492547 [Sordaria brevicollis]|uniref:Uncharacterized protein n=1 Tax=Sordaria brevicollis TaxID=83679 RepID=A0AAE0PKW5_SORBR|nr:hypothetical protein B0T20DRAFT_492547 [Sordaria brevicollis]